MPDTQSALRITVEPVDDRRCKFVLSRSVHGPGVREYVSRDAPDSPLAQAVLEVPAVQEVVLSGNVVTVIQDGSLPWSALDPQIRYAIDAATSAGNGGAIAPTTAPADDETLYQVVARVFESQINPAVAQHGGKVELIDVQDGVVVLRMMGGCQGCGMANVTLRQGIETHLRRAVPGFQGLRDITDHAAGTNPYFAAGPK